MKDEELNDLIQTQEEIVKDSFLTKTYSTELCILNALKELKAYRDTGLTPEKLVEIDRLYAEKCKEAEGFEKWIPVSVKLPDKDGNYIVTIKNLTGHNVSEREVFETFYIDCDGCGWVIAGWNDNEVVAWKPLPEPYKGE